MQGVVFCPRAVLLAQQKLPLLESLHWRCMKQGRSLSCVNGNANESWQRVLPGEQVFAAGALHFDWASLYSPLARIGMGSIRVPRKSACAVQRTAVCAQKSEHDGARMRAGFARHLDGRAAGAVIATDAHARKALRAAAECRCVGAAMAAKKV
jgi:hypothetical protein